MKMVLIINVMYLVELRSHVNGREEEEEAAEWWLRLRKAEGALQVREKMVEGGEMDGRGSGLRPVLWLRLAIVDCRVEESRRVLLGGSKRGERKALLTEKHVSCHHRQSEQTNREILWEMETPPASRILIILVCVGVVTGLVIAVNWIWLLKKLERGLNQGLLGTSYKILFEDLKDASSMHS
ncbi:hypothetical protein Cgig2_006224 [Carnegiea gigantea]|uniref:Uncharacterized protein n=1 Tax=Carnegiea gigantea TaxID=171969 RepID=A0A9Q1KZ97_9CARY|nr:hypothetical protein Cgig2_006224 [Carnegiea gigantea]